MTIAADCSSSVKALCHGTVLLETAGVTIISPLSQKLRKFSRLGSL